MPWKPFLFSTVVVYFQRSRDNVSHRNNRDEQRPGGGGGRGPNGASGGIENGGPRAHREQVSKWLALSFYFRIVILCNNFTNKII